MKFILAFVLMCLPAWVGGQTFLRNDNDTSVVTEYLDGKLWAYSNNGGLIVGMTNEEISDDYGRYYQIGIIINNQRDTSVIFNPEDVYSSLVKKNGDTIALDVYTDEEYQKKIKKSQMWAMVLTGISNGLSSGQSGYSTSTTSTVGANGSIYFTTTTHYNANAAAQAQSVANQRMMSLGRLFEEDRNIRRQGYLKKNTIHPGETICGYMNIKRKKGKLMVVDIDICGCNYCFAWDVGKKRK